MKKVRSILGNSGAVVTLALAAAAPLVLFGWFQRAIGAAGLHIDAVYSGGEVARVIEHEGDRVAVNRPVTRRSPLQRVGSFVQVTWTPVSRVPARVSEQVDLDGDGTPDVLLSLDSQKLVMDATPLNPRYRRVHCEGVASFSELITRVNDGLVARLPLD
jgi:hypothetical protein